MKCKQCGSTTYIYHHESGSKGLLEGTEFPIGDLGDLNTHKRQAHPAEWQAAQEGKRDRKMAKAAAERYLLRRQHEAGATIARPVLGDTRFGDQLLLWHVDVGTTQRLPLSYSYSQREDGSVRYDYRYPEREAWEIYLGYKEQIANLEALVEQVLAAAYEG